jgi:hypothetical protein
LIKPRLTAVRRTGATVAARLNGAGYDVKALEEFLIDKCNKKIYYIIEEIGYTPSRVFLFYSPVLLIFLLCVLLLLCQKRYFCFIGNVSRW